MVALVGTRNTRKGLGCDPGHRVDFGHVESEVPLRHVEDVA